MPLGSLFAYGGSPVGGSLALGFLALVVGGTGLWINDVLNNPHNPFYGM